VVGRSRSILLTSNDDGCTMHDDDDVDGGCGCSREKKERAWDPSAKLGARGREREEGRAAVTTLARFVSGKRK
jgi:hypothetical protein